MPKATLAAMNELSQRNQVWPGFGSATRINTGQIRVAALRRWQVVRLGGSTLTSRTSQQQVSTGNPLVQHSKRVDIFLAVPSGSAWLRMSSGRVLKPSLRASFQSGFVGLFRFVTAQNQLQTFV